MSRRTVMILTAVALEARAVAEALGLECPGWGRAGSSSGRQSVSLHLIGIGARGVREVPVAAEGVSCVVMAGLAGALDPSLRVGDIVIDEMPGSIVLRSAARRGRIHTSDRIVATPGEKAELFARTGALAVEMENAAVREWARQHGAAFVAIRAISDRADQSLDPAVLRLVDGWGRPRPLPIFKTLIRRPSLLPKLIRLGADSKAAARQLGTAVREFVNECQVAGGDG